MPLYDVTFPFIRMVQGPVDYTPGAYRNATREGFRIDYRNPMSQGTRAHQVAAYVVFDAPLVMLCDSPTRYMADEACTRFIASLPVVFDTTRVLAGEATLKSVPGPDEQAAAKDNANEMAKQRKRFIGKSDC